MSQEISRVVFFGDSLTDGYTLGMQAAYPSHIQEKITHAGLPYEVINAGKSGETSADGLTRIDSAIAQPVALFFLALGANDGLRGVPVSEMEANLQAILDKVKTAHPSATIVIAGMIPLHERSDATEFRDVFPRLAARNSATLYPFLLTGVYGNPNLYLDSIHPNAMGHSIMADEIWEALMPFLSK